MLTNIDPTPDYVAESCATIDAIYAGLLNRLVSDIQTAMDTVTHNERHTRAEFWARVGPRGAVVMAKLKAWITFLAANDPARLTPSMLAAGEGLHVDPATGIVTVTDA